MKKTTLILFFTLLGILALPAQKNSTLFDKNSTEATYQQNDKSAENNATPKFSVNSKNLYASNVENGATVEIYSALGAKVLTAVYNGNPISLSNLNKGVYIVRTGKFTQKIML